MAGLDYPQLSSNISPESIIEDYYQRGLTDMDQRYRSQWDEVNRRASTMGRRKQNEMLSDIQARMTKEVNTFRQAAQNQIEEFQLIDQLAQQRGFDPYEAKMRMVLGPEAERAAFPTQAAPRSTALQFGELDTYERKLEEQRADYRIEPSSRVKQWHKPWFMEGSKPASLKVFDRSLKPQYDKKRGWTSGDWRNATDEERGHALQLARELKDVREQKRQLMNIPDIAKRVRGTMLREKRDPAHDSLVARVQKSANMGQPGPQVPPRPLKPKRQQITPTAEQLRELGTKQAYDEGVRLGYWE